MKNFKNLIFFLLQSDNDIIDVSPLLTLMNIPTQLSLFINL